MCHSAAFFGAAGTRRLGIPPTYTKGTTPVRAPYTERPWLLEGVRVSSSQNGASEAATAYFRGSTLAALEDAYGSLLAPSPLGSDMNTEQANSPFMRRHIVSGKISTGHVI